MESCSNQIKFSSHLLFTASRHACVSCSRVLLAASDADNSLSVSLIWLMSISASKEDADDADTTGGQYLSARINESCAN